MESLEMLRRRIILMCVLVAWCAVIGWVRAGDDAGGEAPELGSLRLSALVSAGTRHLAGFVDTATGTAYLIPVGGRLMNWRVTAIDEKEMNARLVNDAGQEIRVDLKGDASPHADDTGEPENNRIKTLAEFIAEHPALTETTLDAENPPLASPGTTSYEAFLASHPEMAGWTNGQPPPSQGGVPSDPAGIEPTLKLPVPPSVDVP